MHYSRRNFLATGGFALLTPAAIKARLAAIQQSKTSSPSDPVVNLAVNQSGAIITEIANKYNGKPQASHAERLALIHDNLAAYLTTIGADAQFQTALSQSIARNGRDKVIHGHVDNGRLHQIARDRTGLNPAQVDKLLNHRPADNPDRTGRQIDGLVAGTQTLTGQIAAAGQAFRQLANSGRLASNSSPHPRNVVLRQSDGCEILEIFIYLEYGLADAVMIWGLWNPVAEVIGEWIWLDAFAWQFFDFFVCQMGWG